MILLKRLNYRPNTDALTPAETDFVQQVFDPFANEVVVYGEHIRWEEIDELEVVIAPRAAGPAGWFLRKLQTQEYYHVGIYYGRQESVIPNISLPVTRYLVQTIAYYAPLPVRFKGPPDLTPTVDE
jgi:hypothetical protein